LQQKCPLNSGHFCLCGMKKVWNKYGRYFQTWALKCVLSAQEVLQMPQQFAPEWLGTQVLPAVQT
jgi:hypothetical protein